MQPLNVPSTPSKHTSFLEVGAGLLEFEVKAFNVGPPLREVPTAARANFGKRRACLYII
jgi:hypothetical protein